MDCQQVFYLSEYHRKRMYKNPVVQRTCVDTTLLQRRQNGVVRLLRLEVSIEQQRVTLRPPRVAVPNTPYCDTDAVVLVQAGLDDIGPVRLLRVLDINLSQRAFGSGSTQCGHGGRRVCTLARLQVALRTDTVDGHAGRAPLLDLVDQAGCFGVRGRVEVYAC